MGGIDELLEFLGGAEARGGGKEIADMIMVVLNDLPALKVAADGGLKAFRSYFSVKRMAREVLAVLGLETN